MSRSVALALLLAVAAGVRADAPQNSTADVDNPASRSEQDAGAMAPAAAAGAYEFHGPASVIVEGRLTVDVMEMVALYCLSRNRNRPAERPGSHTVRRLDGTLRNQRSRAFRPWRVERRAMATREA